MIYRRLNPKDAICYQSLRLIALREAPTAFASSAEEESAFPISKVEGRLKEESESAVFGAFKENDLVATSGLLCSSRPKLSHRGEVWGVFARPDSRGQGHARRVLELTLDHARDARRLHHLILGVNAKNSVAIALYRSLGFNEIGLEQAFMIVDGVPQDELIMAIRL